MTFPARMWFPPGQPAARPRRCRPALAILALAIVLATLAGAAVLQVDEVID